MNNENKEKNVVSDEMTTELEKADATQSQAFEADSHTMIVQVVICKGWFLPSNTYDCGSFVVN